jgi:hypothetical protein
MNINIKFPTELQVSTSDLAKSLVIVCSHERSGTHFLMNALNDNSIYSSEPFINFDLIPLGHIVNFYSHDSVENFIRNIKEINLNGDKKKVCSIIKSHHAVQFFEKCLNNKNIKFIYIYRDPLSVMKSFWKLIHHFNWFEGPKCQKLSDFILSPPQGQLMRYQYKSSENLFNRWANHVNDWVLKSEKNSNIILVNYDVLSRKFNSEIEKILYKIGVNSPDLIKLPDKNKFIKGSQLNLDESDLKLSKNLILEKLNKFPELKKLF